MTYEADKLLRDMAKDPMVRRAEPEMTASLNGGSPLLTVADGITLRDWFAGQALISFANIIEVKQSSATAKVIADLAYEMADAMLAALAADAKGAGPDDAKLPCDVMVAPRTLIGKGCPVSILMLAISKRAGWDDESTRIRSAIVDPPAAIGAGSAPEWTREDLAVGLAALDGIALRRIKSTVGPADDANNWREYLGRADDLMVHLSAAPGEAP